jgi:Fe-S-cluster containining protein
MSQESSGPVSLYQPADRQSLTLQSRFTFQCHGGLACFNQCCRTPTILLSPYDILRLKQCLGLTSGEFLRRYTRQEIEERSNLPLIFLDAFRSPATGCPFVAPEGCRVYPHRPAACRLFPLTMGSQLTDRGTVDYYFCRRLDYCQGFAAEQEWTVKSWMDSQGFAEFEQGRREWLEIILRAGVEGARLGPPVRALFFTAAYDLDNFRDLICEPAFLQAHPLEGRMLDHLRADDTGLLEFSYTYLKSFLLKQRGGVMEASPPEKTA